MKSKRMENLNKNVGRLLFAITLAGGTAFGNGETISEEAELLVGGNNRFALELYERLAAETFGNVFISPWSITTAFGMAWAGASGDTADEMAEILHLPSDQAATHPLFGELIDIINRIQEDGKLILHTANALWPAVGQDVLSEYTNILDTHYGAHAEALDYKAETEGSRQRINGWVANQTAERIMDLIPEGVIGPETAIVLTNAIYFKGAWKTLFDPEETRPAQFTLSDGTEIEVDMMSMEEELLFYKGNGLTLVTLPYHNEHVEAVLISPDDGDIRALEAKLSTATLAEWLDQRSEEKGLVRLPRFSLRYKEELSDLLKAMGMELPFLPGAADFSGIFGHPNLFISKVVHETFLQVKEEGTEAAGATAIIIEVTSGVPVPTFNGDRPFLFLIRDTLTGSLLFMGRIAEPEPIEDEPEAPNPDTVRACFGDQVEFIDGWWQNTGIGRFKADSWPWLQHESLGWLYLDAPTANPAKGSWIYDFSLGWLHTSPANFPTFWSHTESWILFLTESSFPRWFYRYADGNWVAK